MLKQEKRIAIIHAEGVIDTVPCLMSAIAMLSESGYHIDIFILKENKYLLPKFSHKNVNVFSFEPPISGKMLNRWPVLLPIWVWAIIKITKLHKYNYLLGVDPLGIVASAILGRIKAIPIIYLSLEIYVSNEIRRKRDKLLKLLEIKISQKAFFTIVQDKSRALLLQTENAIHRDKIQLLPNSSIGKATLYSSRLLRDKFGITNNKKIILCAGTIAKWTMAMELATSTDDWPDDWVLVLHSRNNLNNDEYTKKIKEIKKTNIVLSDTPLPYSEIGELMASADIGVALYQPTDWHTSGTNLSTMGLSSGKISQYLKYGIPVITSDFPDLKELITRYSCGVCIRSPEEIKKAISTIINDISTYRMNAVKCYEEEFEFSVPFNKILKRLGAL